MIFRLMLVSGTLLLASGCDKKTESADAATPAVSTALSAPGAQPGGADMESALRELTQAVRKYSVERKQVPKTFSEVLAAGYVQHLPTAPPGSSAWSRIAWNEALQPSGSAGMRSARSIRSRGCPGR